MEVEHNVCNVVFYSSSRPDRLKDVRAVNLYVKRCMTMIALLNLYISTWIVLGFSFVVFNDKAKRTQQGDLL